MGIKVKELLEEYHRLNPTDQAVFAGMVRAHQLFNTQEWREELARRSRLLESEDFMPITKIEKLLKDMESA